VKEANIPMLAEEVDAAQALANLTWYGEKVRQAAAVVDAEREALPSGSWEGLLKSPEALTEGECKEVLQGIGIAVTREGLAASAREAVDLARQIGYPVVLKIASPDIAHKTEVGGIRLGLDSDKEVRRAYSEIIAAAKAARPDALIRGVLVQEMVSGGIEVIVGTTEDPVFGPVVMFGLGGVFVEALKDVSFRIVPIVRHDAAEMVREIKGFRVLQGMRGRPPADLEAIEDVILKVSRLVEAWGGRIRELDINPLIVFPQGAKVVDALIVKKALP
jgi:acyl-CoA synthetase (NDP forming)